MVDESDKKQQTIDEQSQISPEKQTPNKKDKKKEEEEQLSEEDAKLKTDLELLVERLKEDDSSLYEASLNALKESIKNSTSSMTAVPKPLKFLRPTYPDLCSIYDKWTDPNLKSSLADVLSILAMTYSENGKHDSLRYRLLSDVSDFEGWGHEYIRHLALEIGEVYNDQVEKDAEDETSSDGSKSDGSAATSGFEFSKEDTLRLCLDIVPYFLKHNWMK